jgi:two-component system alkaline phosphatase synthesis response regulator PhoP
VSKRVLLIDDEDDIREVAAMSLEMVAQCTVFEARFGEEGVRKADEEQPDVILLDVMMPAIDGPTTLLQLRACQSTRHIPVIFLTAKVQAADLRRFHDLGASGVIAKPFDPMLLAREITAILKW